VELLSERNLKDRENDKADVRHALMMSAIASVSGNKVPPKKYLIDWDDEHKIDKTAQLKKSKNFWNSLSQQAGKRTDV